MTFEQFQRLSKEEQAAYLQQRAAEPVFQHLFAVSGRLAAVFEGQTRATEIAVLCAHLGPHLVRFLREREHASNIVSARPVEDLIALIQKLSAIAVDVVREEVTAPAEGTRH